ncbi:hypothetical protein [Streptococcus parasanguinis]|uniref:hypothetical protein n=1 Tax=Streptococcus parasanguinis TaxID=1318 RepID=UPI0039C08A9B
MENNNLQLTPKQWISIGSLFLIMVLNYYFKNPELLFILFSGYYFFMLVLWRREIIKEWINTKKLRQRIQKRFYFYVTESGYKTDIIKRRKIGRVVLLTVYGIFFALGILFYLFNIIGLNLHKIKILGVGIDVVSLIVMLLVLAVVLLNMRYYWTSLYYYVIPIVSLGLSSVKIEDIGSTESIIKYFCFLIMMYVIFVLLLPIPYLRKVTSSTLIFGALLSIIIPVLIEHILSNYIIGQFTQPTMIMHKFSNILPNEFNYLLHKSGYTDEINEIIELLFLVIIKSKLKIFSTINFLWLSGYVLGSFVINIKLKLGEMRASSIYDRIIYGEKVTYNTLRDVVYFGGDSYKNRIIDNVVFRTIIYNKESKKEFLEVEHHWIIKLLLDFWKWCLNKLQQCIQ